VASVSLWFIFLVCEFQSPAASATEDTYQIRARKIWKIFPNLESIFEIQFGIDAGCAIRDCQVREARGKMKEGVKS